MCVGKNSNKDTVIEKTVEGSEWALMRKTDSGTYFFIRSLNRSTFCPMLELSDVSNNFFQCRSIAVAVYDAFVQSCSQINKGA